MISVGFQGKPFFITAIQVYAPTANANEAEVCFQCKPFEITAIQIYAPTTNSEESEVEWLYDNLKDLLELTPKEDVIFIIGDWNEKVGSQETPGVTDKFGLAIQNEAGQRLTEFCQEMMNYK